MAGRHFRCWRHQVWERDTRRHHARDVTCRWRRRRGMIELRPYQTALVSRIYDAFNNGQRRVLVPLPTGGGKTIVAATVVADCVGKPQPVVFLAHRDELVMQAADKLHDLRMPSGFIKANLPSNPDALVQIASVQTMHARCTKSSRLDLPTARLI